MTNAKTSRPRAKRGQPEPYLRADGRWCVTLDLGRRPDGRRWRLPVYGRSPDEVRAAVPDARRRAKRSSDEYGPDTKLSVWAAKWLELIRPKWDEQGRRTGVKPSTWRGYEKHVRTNIAGLLIGRKRLGELDRDLVQEWQDWLGSEERGLSPRSVQYARTTLDRCLEEAWKRQLIGRNPLDLVTAPAQQTSFEATIFTLEEARSFLRAIRGDPDEALYLVSIFAGPRQGETLELTVRDFNATTGVVTFKHTLDWVEGAASIEENKTATSRRSVRLPEYVVDVVRVHLARLATQRTTVRGWVEYGFLFPGEKGQPRRGSVIYRRLHRLLAKNGLPTLRWHDLRHSAASLMLALGIPMQTVQRLLGHSSLEMLAKRYGHLVPELLAAEVAKLQAALVEFEEADEVIDAAIVDGLADGDDRETGTGDWLSGLAVKAAEEGAQGLVSSSVGP